MKKRNRNDEASGRWVYHSRQSGTFYMDGVGYLAQ